MPSSGDLLTTDQVAAILQVTPRTVRRWGCDGVLPRLRAGGRVTRYRAADLAALIDRGPEAVRGADRRTSLY
jgi:excisionase family DNA binding protein